ncbi:hypothetical protein C0Q70_12820 [Pomacea canaliculata]|uniref:Secreted protein n=1 Tax=Pomacea canaliculata TaxID=400727 RepID=A0A2T7P2N7_POMCA|nr:hypothetical protein C0Q70_12820 [Pomacea canaliculata]
MATNFRCSSGLLVIAWSSSRVLYCAIPVFWKHCVDLPVHCLDHDDVPVLVFQRLLLTSADRCSHAAINNSVEVCPSAFLSSLATTRSRAKSGELEARRKM